MKEKINIMRIGNSKGLTLPAYWYKRFDKFEAEAEVSDNYIEIIIKGIKSKSRGKGRIKKSVKVISTTKNKKSKIAKPKHKTKIDKTKKKKTK